MTTTSFHANGKLLLSGEYFVLDGAEAIGLPCRLGQSLNVKPLEENGFLHWNSYLDDGQSWFQATFQKADHSIVSTNDTTVAEVLQQMFQQIRLANPDFLNTDQSLKVQTHLEFPRLWGLGSSSTLIHLLAQWSQVDPFELSTKTLGGSGYDIACAGVNHPILYQLKDGKPQVELTSFDPVFKDQLYFVYLSKKQNSREGIQRYRAKSKHHQKAIEKISAISRAFLRATTLEDFQKLIVEHEHIVSKAIEMPRAQELYFSDFEGTVKSLGAWGGDFVLVATELSVAAAQAYFNKKGFEVFLTYNELI